jgi:IclR family pca regulon transcriptional regulator
MSEDPFHLTDGALLDRFDRGSVSGSSTFVRSVARALKVISGFGADAPSQTVSQVAAKASLDRATARRILLTLEELGYLRSDGRQFSLTPLVLELGYAYMSGLPFWSVAYDILKDLADSMQVFCVIVATDSNYDHVWVVSSVRPSSPPMFMDFPDIGRRAPAHMIAPGIILLGALTGQELNRALLASTDGDQQASLTALREQVTRDRRQGWSLRVVPEQNYSEIAVPLLDGQGRIIAGMSVHSPLSRISSEEAVKQYLPRIKQAAEDINRLVGYRGP